MVLMLLPLFAGAVMGRLLGGRLAAVGELRFRAPALIFAVVASQAMLGRAPRSARGAFVLLTYVAVGAWIILNARRRSRPFRLAFVLVGVGWAMNFAAMAPTGAMPVSEEALAVIGAPAHLNVEDGHLFKHERRGSRGPTSWLGDEIPIASLKAVISVGDIALAAGILMLVASAMLGDAPRPVRGRALRVRNGSRVGASPAT